jgi:hypothetical protein
MSWNSVASRRSSPPPAVESGTGVVHAQAGGAERGGLTIQGMSVWNRALSPEEIKARYEAGKRKQEEVRALKLSTWLSETSVIVAGVRATRRDVIKFVANKLGGVHLDPKRSAADKSYGALDAARASVQLADLDAVYHELSSIGQQFATSADIRAMVA